ncbi:peptidase C39 family protein [Sesbania bispinosa]|nr:peptidase C39 family protein [Sesbania bispinosa]
MVASSPKVVTIPSSSLPLSKKLDVTPTPTPTSPSPGDAFNLIITCLCQHPHLHHPQPPQLTRRHPSMPMSQIVQMEGFTIEEIVFVGMLENEAKNSVSLSQGKWLSHVREVLALFLSHRSLF